MIAVAVRAMTIIMPVPILSASAAPISGASEVAAPMADAIANEDDEEGDVPESPKAAM
ncbi:hypothetical protein [Paraburkholderia unamae]|uniref:hypothetical protein n=1 Tax=Paraburkholderia unamae TaxID=219649 RepID=UPI001402D931|nr:hypothetical protein [Paraburkholderia unamae]